MKPCILLLTCANNEEADKITSALFDQKLAVCAKKFPVSSSFLWKGSKNHSEEVMLIMDSIEEKFDKVNAVVRSLHSYDTYVLTALPISQTTKEVHEWLNSELAK